MLSEEHAKECSAELVALKEQLVDTVAMLEALRKEKTTLQAQGQQVCERLYPYLHLHLSFLARPHVCAVLAAPGGIQKRRADAGANVFG